MIRVEIPKDINSYKSELALGFTARQVICLIVVIAMAIPTFLVLSNYMSTSGIIYIVVLEAILPMLIGFYSINDQPFESFLKVIINYFTVPTQRKYVDKSKIDELHLEIKELSYQIEVAERQQYLRNEKAEQKMLRKKEKVEAKNKKRQERKKKNA